MLITNVTKGEALTFTLSSHVSFTSSTPYGLVPQSQGEVNSATKSIIKDNGSVNALTNTPTYLSNGMVQVSLTATEMNADVIDVYLYQNSGNKFLAHARIETTSGAGGGGLSLSDTVTDITDLSDSDPTLGEVLSLIWLMIRKGERRTHKNLKKVLKDGL